jgi:hypothetical protein
VVKDPEEIVETLLREVEGWKKMRVRSVGWAIRCSDFEM